MFKYFKLEDFECSETGENNISHDFVHRLDDLREACGIPFYITSGFRSKEHSVEKRKAKPGTGTHARGIAADIAVQGGVERLLLVEKALELGFKGVGVAKGFVHVDMRDTTPVLWCY